MAFLFMSTHRCVLLLLLLSSAGAAAVPNRIDFAGFSAGDWVSDVGQGTTVTVQAAPGVGCFGGPNGNEPMIFDSENPSDIDLDLGSPHKDFGGPGRGQGGRKGTPGENSVPLGNLIIISEDCNTEIPNDEQLGGVFTFTFDTPRGIKALGGLDFSKGIKIEVTSANGSSGAVFEYEGLGTNGFIEALLNVENVIEMRVITRDSGGIAYVDLLHPIDPVGAYGDPHFKKWDGGIYSFNGACDLVLLQHPDFDDGEGLTIHLRTSINTRDNFSFIKNVVIKIGENRLEVATGDEDGETLTWSDGVANDEAPTTIHGYPITYRNKVMSNGVLHVYGVQLGADNKIVIKSFPGLVDIRIRSGDSRQTRFGTSLGLLGNLAGELIGRDGSTVFDDIVEFAEHWQVKPSEQILFHDELPGPATCSFPPSQTRLNQAVRSTARKSAATAKQDGERI